MAMLSPGPLTVPEFVPVMNALPAQLESGEWQQKALAACRPILLEDIADHFTRAQGPDGPWPPRKRKGDGHPLLVETSAMFQAAVGNGRGHVDRMGDGELEVGLDAGAFRPGYPLFHQHGTKKMPARPFVWSSEEAQAGCSGVISEYLQAELFG